MIQILKSAKDNKSKEANQDSAPNRFTVLYTLEGVYHHAGCSSQEEAQLVLSKLMTDGNRIPVGIYDYKTDSFEWEAIGEYLYSQDLMSDPEARLEEVLTISRALRRRDSSWHPEFLGRPSFFA